MTTPDTALVGAKAHVAADERMQIAVADAVQNLLEKAESERWNRLASWILFVGGILVTALWSVVGIGVADFATDAPTPVVVSGMVTGTLAVIAGAVLLLVASLRPATGVRAAVEALEARKRLEQMNAEIKILKLRIDQRVREAREREPGTLEAP